MKEKMKMQWFVQDVDSIILMIVLLMDAKNMIVHATVAKPCEQLRINYNTLLWLF
tara:strand:- start:721 stop:885 length:165 start_codon:yes stop_codon:yes gene_type:complete